MLACCRLRYCFDAITSAIIAHQNIPGFVSQLIGEFITLLLLVGVRFLLLLRQYCTVFPHQAPPVKASIHVYSAHVDASFTEVACSTDYGIGKHESYV